MLPFYRKGESMDSPMQTPKKRIIQQANSCPSPQVNIARSCFQIVDERLEIVSKNFQTDTLRYKHCIQELTRACKIHGKAFSKSLLYCILDADEDRFDFPKPQPLSIKRFNHSGEEEGLKYVIQRIQSYSGTEDYKENREASLTYISNLYNFLMTCSSEQLAYWSSQFGERYGHSTLYEIKEEQEDTSAIEKRITELENKFEIDIVQRQRTLDDATDLVDSLRSENSILLQTVSFYQAELSALKQAHEK